MFAQRSVIIFLANLSSSQVGCDIFTDVHGDEEYPYNFIAGSEGIPKWGPRLMGLHGAYVAAYARANSDMQIEYSYEPDPAMKGPLNICSNQIGER